MQQEISLAQFDDFLCEHFQYICKNLKHAPFTNTIRTESALEESANFALGVNQHNSQNGVKQNDEKQHNQAFNANGEPLRHDTRKQRMKPFCNYTKVEHIFLSFYRSISGITKSIVPPMAMRSAIFSPRQAVSIAATRGKPLLR